MTRKRKTTTKSTGLKKSARKSAAQKRRPAKKLAKKARSKKAAAKKKRMGTKTVSTTIESSRKKDRGESSLPDQSAFFQESSGSQSGDLQGVSNIETVDSESVDELLEEGNAFEAGIVSGVEDSREREGREVHTREIPEDDVPTEYLDEK